MRWVLFIGCATASPLPLNIQSPGKPYGEISQQGPTGGKQRKAEHERFARICEIVDPIQRRTGLSGSDGGDNAGQVPFRTGRIK